MNNDLKRRRYSFLGGLIVFFLIALTCCDKNKDTAPKTVKVKRGSLEVVVSAPGKIVPHKQVTIKSKAAGEIKEIMVKEGDTVKSGALLIRLDPMVEESRMEQARAEHQAAQASVKKSRAELKKERDHRRRGKALYKDGILSKTEYEDRRHAVTLARNNLVIARSSEQAIAHALAEAEDRLSYTEIKAPMDGVVLNLDAAPGQVVSSGMSGLDTGTPLMVMADLSQLLIIAEVEETDVAAVVTGQETRALVDAYPGAIFNGKVERVSPEAIEKGAVTIVEVRIALDNKTGATLRPGMSATVEIVTAERHDALLVPVSAIRDRSGPGVVLIKDGATAWQPVELGVGDWEMVVVESGLTEGQELVLPKGAILPTSY